MIGQNALVSMIPEMLNKIPIQDINDEIIDIAFSKGYNFSERTPLRLFENKKIIDYIIDKKAFFVLEYPGVIDRLKKETYHSYKNDFYRRIVFAIIDTNNVDYFKYIDYLDNDELSDFKFTKDTPLQFYRVPIFIQHLISKKSFYCLEYPNVIDTIKEAGLYEPVAKALISSGYTSDKIDRNYLEGYYNLIPVDNQKIIDFLNTKYYKYNPEILYSDKFKPVVNSDTYEFFKECKDRIDPFKINFKNDKNYLFFSQVIKVFPELLKKYDDLYANAEINDKTRLENALRQSIKDGVIKYRDLVFAGINEHELLFRSAVFYDLEGVLEFIDEITNDENKQLLVSVFYHKFDEFFLHHYDMLPSLFKMAREGNQPVKNDELFNALLQNNMRNCDMFNILIENGVNYPTDAKYKEDAELLNLFFEKTINSLAITYIIDHCNYKLVDRGLFLKRIKEYTLTDDTSDEHLEDFEFINMLECKLENVKMVLKKYGSKVPRDYLVKAMKNGYNVPSTIIDVYLKDDLTDDIIRLAIDNNYFISHDTPDAIKNSPVYVKLIINSHPKELLRVLDYTTVPYNMLIDASNIDMILEAMINNYISNNSSSVIGFGSFDNNQESLNSIREELSKLSLDDKLIKFYRTLDNLKTVGNHLRSVYIKHTLIRFSRVSLEDLDKIKDFTLRVDMSNSSEIHAFASTILDNLLETDNYEKAYEEVEKIFVKDNTPMVGKIFSVFKTLNPTYEPYRHNGICSPTITYSSSRRNDLAIFGDLLKCALGSNNRSLRDYIMNLSLNTKFIEAIENGDMSFDDLMPSDKEQVSLLVNHIYTIVTNTRINKLKNAVLIPDENMDTAIKNIKNILEVSRFSNTNVNLIDRITEMFCYPLGIRTYEDLITFANSMINKRTEASIDLVSSQDYDLVPGDLVKGLNSYDYIGNIMQNGSVAKEFLGDCADSDSTPLDTDLSVVQKAGEPSEAIKGLVCYSYGPLWAVIKNKGDFKITRSNLRGESDSKYDPNKYELFYTGVLGIDHYGIRTGIPSSRIDYFMTTCYEDRIGLEIAMNGFYIPVIDLNTKRVYFTYEDYLDLRCKLSGLSYLGSSKFLVASKEDLVTSSILENAKNIVPNKNLVNRKHNAIKDKIREVSREFGYCFKEKFDRDVSGKIIELVDTGSTSRCTDLPGKADFDYICRIDRELIINEELFSKLRDAIFEKFKICEDSGYVADHKKIAITGAKIEGEEEPVDIEISFVSRTNKLNFSSESSLKTRLDTIRCGNVESLGGEIIEDTHEYYPLVVGNILEAKKLFKEHHCYKKHGSNPSEGGLGGIGIENWILQHGGSLKLASIDFLKAALQYPNYDNFKLHYHVWDFGENHYALEKGKYPHDEFVYKNMDSEGFKNMVEACKAYLLSINYDMSLLETNSEEIKRVQ